MEHKNTIEVAAFQGYMELTIGYDEIRDVAIARAIKSGSGDSSRIVKNLERTKSRFDRYIITALSDKFRASRVRKLENFDVDFVVHDDKEEVVLLVNYKTVVTVPSNRQMVIK